MAYRDDRAYQASLGTVFVVDRDEDVVWIAGDDGLAVQVPGPDLREFLDSILPSDRRASGSSYTRVMERVGTRFQAIESRVQEEVRDAEAALAELLALPSSERSGVVESRERFRTRSLVSKALERSLKMVHHDPSLALELAELARRVAACLNPQVYIARQIRDLQGHAAAVFGNALRVAGDLRGARRAFVEAREYLALGTTESPEELEVDSLEISLRRSLRDFPRALELTESVFRRYLDLGETNAAAQTLHRRAVLLDGMGDAEAAIAVLQQAAAVAGDTDDPVLELTIRHSLVLCLARAGRVTEAAERFRCLQGLYRSNSSPLLDARRHWAEGVIELEAGNPAGVLAPLARARGIFESLGYAFDLAQVSLDLAAALAGLGRADEVRELAVATHGYFESREVHSEALAALAIFQQAAAHRQVTRELLRDVAKRLDEASSRRPSIS